MKPSPSQNFDSLVSGSTRRVTERVMMSIDGVLKDITHLVKNVQMERSAGSSKVATFTAALASELTMTLAGADAYLGSKPLRNAVVFELGFDGSNVGMFKGQVQSIIRNASDDETIVTCLDDALALTRTSVSTPPMFNVNSMVYAKEILEHAGVSSRIKSPSELMFALDFDGNSHVANVSVRSNSSSVSDNGVNLTTINPHPWYGFDRKNYYYENSERSQRVVIDNLTIKRYGDSEDQSSFILVDPSNIVTASNAQSKQFIAIPSGYGGGAVTNPAVLHFPNGLGGYRYYMAVTPSPRLRISESEAILWKSNGYSLVEPNIYGIKGDPMVVVSDDGHSWSAPPWTNPLGTRPTYTRPTVVKRQDPVTGKWSNYTMQVGDEILGTMNCDATLLYFSGKLYCIWRYCTGNTERWVYREYNPAASTWGAVAVWASFDRGTHISPSFVAVGSTIHIFWVNRNKNPNILYHGTASAVGGQISTHNTSMPIPSTLDVYRASVISDPSGNGFYACVTLCANRTDNQSPRLYLGVSRDGNSWTLSQNRLVTPLSTGWDNCAIESGCLVYNKDDISGQVFDLYYSAYNNNQSRGLGKTAVYQRAMQYGGVSPDKIPYGPVLYGPITCDKMIDGKTPISNELMWPQSVNDGERVVSFGGWFCRKGIRMPDGGISDPGINWSDGRSFLFMEAMFGNDVKALLHRSGAYVKCSLYRRTGVSWTLLASSSKQMSGAWGSDEVHFIGGEIHVSVNQYGVYTGFVTLVVDDYRASSSASTGFGGFGGLTGVCLVSPVEKFFESITDSYFPGLSYDNLFVCIGDIPNPLPEPAYSLEKGLNIINAAAYYGSNPWEELKEIASAELGCFVYDYNGKLLFLNRHHFTDPNNIGIVKTLSYDDESINLIVSEDVSDIRNIVNVRVKSQSHGIARDIWSLSTDWVIPAQTTETRYIEIPGCLEAVDVIPSPLTSYGGTRYRAAYVSGMVDGYPITSVGGAMGSQGGAEGKLEFKIEPAGRIVAVTICNTSNRDIALRDGGGNPYFYIWGKAYHEARFSSQLSPVIIERDDESVNDFGANEYEVNLEYITNADNARNLAKYLLARYSSGIKRIKEALIAGDPRIEIGDRIRIVHPGMGLDETFWVERITDRISSSVGYTQALSVSVADMGRWFMLDGSRMDDEDTLAY